MSQVITSTYFYYLSFTAVDTEGSLILDPDLMLSLKVMFTLRLGDYIILYDMK